MPILGWTLLAATNAAAFIVGMAGPWHYGDFAATCRTGADTARRLRRKLEEVRGVLHLVSKGIERMSDSSVELNGRLNGAGFVCEALADLEPSLFDLRDDRLQSELSAFFTATTGRVRWGQQKIVPALNRPGAIEDTDSEGRRLLGTLASALRDEDIPTCERLIHAFAQISSWSGFARHRLESLLRRRPH